MYTLLLDIIQLPIPLHQMVYAIQGFTALLVPLGLLSCLAQIARTYLNMVVHPCLIVPPAWPVGIVLWDQPTRWFAQEDITALLDRQKESLAPLVHTVIILRLANCPNVLSVMVGIIVMVMGLQHPEDYANGVRLASMIGLFAWPFLNLCDFE